MIAGGQETKCFRIVHGVGREPIEVARPCTSGEKEINWDGSMFSGGQETKCFRIVHGVGREPIEVARPCTSGEKKAREQKGPTKSPAKATDEAQDAQQKLKKIETGQYQDPCDTGGKWAGRRICWK